MRQVLWRVQQQLARLCPAALLPGSTGWQCKHAMLLFRFIILFQPLLQPHVMHSLAALSSADHSFAIMLLTEYASEQ